MIDNCLSELNTDLTDGTDLLNQIVFADGVTANQYSTCVKVGAALIVNLRITIAAGTYTSALFTLPVSTKTRIYFSVAMTTSGFSAEDRLAWCNTNGAVTFFTSSATISSDTVFYFNVVLPVA